MLIKNDSQPIDDFEMVLFEDEIGESSNINKQTKDIKTKNQITGKKAALDKALNDVIILKNKI